MRILFPSTIIILSGLYSLIKQEIKIIDLWFILILSVLLSYSVEFEEYFSSFFLHWEDIIEETFNEDSVMSLSLVFAFILLYVFKKNKTTILKWSVSYIVIIVILMGSNYVLLSKYSYNYILEQNNQSLVLDAFFLENNFNLWCKSKNELQESYHYYFNKRYTGSKKLGYACYENKNDKKLPKEIINISGLQQFHEQALKDNRPIISSWIGINEVEDIFGENDEDNEQRKHIIYANTGSYYKILIDYKSIYNANELILQSINILHLSVSIIWILLLFFINIKRNNFH